MCESNLKEYNLDANLYLQDLIDLNLDNEYDAIVMPTGSFCIIERNQALTVLNKFYEHLSDNGKIIIDIEKPKKDRKSVV